MTTNDKHWDDLVGREALGEPLNEQERMLLARLAEEDPCYRAELEVLRALEDPAFGRDEAREHAIAEAALAAFRDGRVEAEKVEAEKTARVVQLRPWLAGGALAAAAAVAFLFGLPKEAPDGSQAQLKPVAMVPFVKTAGAITIDGKPADQPMTARAGSLVELIQGTACMRPAPTVYMCLGEDTRVKLTDVQSPRRRIDLISGRVVVALEPQPSGSRFSVVAGGIWSTAVGTMFSVEVNEEGVVQTAVYEGKVRVGGEEDGSLVVAHKIGLSTAGGVEIGPVAGPDDSNEWKALEEVSGKRYVPPPAEPEAEATPEPAEETPVMKQQARVAPPAVEEPAAAPEPVERTASDILADARRLRTAQQWSESADAYREILQKHPTSGEAHAVLVSLGELELARLGQPGLALQRFDQYLASGAGSLAIEAKLGRIRALRALGRGGEEAQAIDEFVKAYPQHLDGPALRARRAALGAH